MASKAVATATEAAAKAGPNFRLGKTKVYLPSSCITMLPPRKIVSPFFATFQVPLRFNKFDLRDYLYNVYGVEVRSVHSWLAAQAPRRKYSDPASGKIDPKMSAQFSQGQWYRPAPIKRMMVELVKPFAYPAPPPEPTPEQLGQDDDPRRPWDYDMHRNITRQEEVVSKGQKDRSIHRRFALQSEQPYVPAFRVALAREARELVAGKRAWTNDVALDEKWDDVLKAEAKKP